MIHLRLTFLGGCHVALPTGAALAFATDKASALLSFLAVEGQQPHRREALAGMLWADWTERQARHNLSQTLYTLRQSLERDDTAPPYLLASRATLQWNLAAPHDLDVARLEQVASDAKVSSAQWAQALDQYRGDFLAGLSIPDSPQWEEWAVLRREQLRRTAIDLCERLVTHWQSQGEYEQAAHYAQRQVALAPWMESAHQAAMRLLARAGQRPAALHQFEQCRRYLLEELGVAPAEETLALYEQLRGGTPVVAPAAPTPPPRHALPPATTTFVGRESELAHLTTALLDPGCRLLSVTGPGGIGKTHLLLHAARALVPHFPDGIFFVPLESLSQPEQLAPTLLAHLPLPPAGSDAPAEYLGRTLASKSMLLVLDNFEPIVEAAPLLSDLLAAAPLLKLLVSSRVRLHLREEWLCPLDGLAVPPADTPPHEMAHWSAIQLWVQRAAQACGGWHLTPDNAPLVRRICHAVEGMPLAIEMAAAWTRLLPCEAIAQEVEQGTTLFTTTERNRPARQRSLEALFQASWNLLGEAEQQVYAALSVFQGGFRREAATAVAGATLPILLTLTDQSLLRPSPTGRYSLHPLLRQATAAKLAALPEQEQRVRARHAAYFLAWLEEQGTRFVGPHQSQSIEAVRGDIENVRQAWQWAIAQGDEAALARALRPFYRFHTAHSWYHEGIEALSALIAMLRAHPEPTPDRTLLLGRSLACLGRCQEFVDTQQAAHSFQESLALLRQVGAEAEQGRPRRGLGYLALIRGAYDEARDHLTTSLRLHEAAADRWGMAAAFNLLCQVARRQGDAAEARDLCEQSLALRRQMQDERGLAATLNNYGLILCQVGEYAAAERAFQETLDLSRRLHNQIGVANALNGLCHIAHHRGDNALARDYAAQSQAVYEEVGDSWGAALTLNNIGYLANQMGDYQAAKQALHEAVALYRQHALGSGLAGTLCNLAEAHQALGEWEAARHHYREALEVAQASAQRPHLLKTIIQASHLLHARGESALALELLDFAHAHPATDHLDRTRAAHYLSAFGPLRDEATRARARARTLETTVSELLTLLAPPA